MQNKSGTAGASTNYVLSNDLGTDSSYYGEFGMNSSVYSSGTPTDFYSINNGIYFSGHDGDITFGSGNGFKSYFAWGSSGQSAHVINASGALGFSTNLGTTPALSGTTGYGTAGQVPVSAGSAGAVAWSSTPTLTGTNFTGIPISTGISGLGTGVATALAVAIGSAGAPVLFNGALGTPSSGTLTNCTGLPYSGLTGTVPTWNQNTTGSAGSVSGTVAATTLSASGVVTINTTTNNQSYTTTGAGTITITSGTAGNINNMNIGATTTGTGAFTTLSASSTFTLSGGTANGVLYLNGSKAVTSGTALVFDGTNFSTTGSATATALIPSGSTVPTNGMFLPAANTVAWSTNTTERMRIDSSGNLLMGTTTFNPVYAGDAVQMSKATGQSRMSLSLSTTAQANMITFANPNGQVGYINTVGTSTIYSTTSDQRLKENIIDAPSALASVNAIKVRSFNWKVDGSHQDYGYIAQELLEVAPEAVAVPSNEDEMMGVDFGKLTPRLVKAIQELSAKVTELESKLNS